MATLRMLFGVAAVIGGAGRGSASSIYWAEDVKEGGGIRGGEHKRTAFCLKLCVRQNCVRRFAILYSSFTLLFSLCLCLSLFFANRSTAQFNTRAHMPLPTFHTASRRTHLHSSSSSLPPSPSSLQNRAKLDAQTTLARLSGQQGLSKERAVQPGFTDGTQRGWSTTSLAIGTPTAQTTSYGARSITPGSFLLR